MLIVITGSTINHPKGSKIVIIIIIIAIVIVLIVLMIIAILITIITKIVICYNPVTTIVTVMNARMLIVQKQPGSERWFIKRVGRRGQ